MILLSEVCLMRCSAPAVLSLIVFSTPFALPPATAQSVVSARAGLINYFEGEILVDGQPLARKFGTFTSLKEGSDLVTREGHAEILLTPNTWLRLGENS